MPWPPAAGSAWPPTRGCAPSPRLSSAGQWPDGGWNCDPAAAGALLLHETLAPAGDCTVLAGHRRPGRQGRSRSGANLFLDHRLFRSLATGQVIHQAWLAPRYPPYWHYDILQALLVLSRMGKAC